jgi:diguanylate cyclase (GGDEF)-like protein
MNARQLRFTNLFYRFCQHAGYILFVTGILSGIYACQWEAYLTEGGMDKAPFWFLFTLFLGISGMVVGSCIQKLHWVTDTDPLTNLGNRRYFYRRLTHELTRIKKTKQSSVLAFIDVDDFKHINDTYGHIVGDQVLIRVSAVLRKNTDRGDELVRWGGDEFILILPSTTCEKAERVIKRISRQISSDPLFYGVTISVGLIAVTASMNIDYLLMKADQFLYEAKQTKNSIRHCKR